MKYIIRTVNNSVYQLLLNDTKQFNKKHWQILINLVYINIYQQLIAI